MNEKRVIKVVCKYKSTIFGVMYRLRIDEEVSFVGERDICNVPLEKALGKPLRVGMKLALVDLADYDVEGVNCD